MRFAGNTTNVSSYIQAGKAGAQGVADAFKVARANAPDYGGLGNEALKARSKERQAATEAEAYVAQAGLQAMEGVKLAEKKAEVKIDAAKKKADYTRMAGALGAIGAVATGGVAGYMNKKEEAAQAKRDAATKSFQEQQLEILRRDVDRPGYTPLDRDKFNEENPLSNYGGEDGQPDPTQVNTETTGDGTPELVSTDSPSKKTSGAIPSTSLPSPSAGRTTLSKQQIGDLARNSGFPEADIPVITAIAMGESGGDTGAHNPNASTGDNSYGLMQINMLGGMGPERRAQFNLQKNEDLFDPQKNMDAAFQIYKTQGLEAWGAYTNGSYRNHL